MHSSDSGGAQRKRITPDNKKDEHRTDTKLFTQGGHIPPLPKVWEKSQDFRAHLKDSRVQTSGRILE